MGDAEFGLRAYINGFKNIEKLLPVKVITKGSNVSPLPERLLSFDDFTYSVGYKSYDIDDYFKKFNIGGMIILVYLLAGIAIGGIIYSEISKSFKNG